MPESLVAARSIASHPVPTSRSFEQTLITGAAAFALLAAVVWTAQGSLVSKTDFALTYLGAHMVKDGAGAKLYDPVEQQKAKASLFENANPTAYEHPPFEALLLAPLAMLSYRTAYLIWGFINALIWLCAPFIMRPYAPAPRDELCYVALWLVFAPLGIALFQGQSSMLILLLYLMTFISLKKRNDYVGGLLLGLGLFKFQFVIPFAAILLLRRKWRFVTGFCTTGAMFAALSYLAVGWFGILAYIRLLLTASRSPRTVVLGAATDMATLDSFLHVTLGNYLSGESIGLATVGASVLLIVVTAWLWHEKSGDPSDRGWDLFYAAAVVVSLITGMHMFAHDLSPLIVPMLLVIPYLRAEGKGLQVLLGVLMVFFWMPPLYLALVAWHSLYLMFLPLMMFAIALLMLANNCGNAEPVSRATAGS